MHPYFPLFLALATFSSVTLLCFGAGQLLSRHLRVERRLEKTAIWTGRETAGGSEGQAAVSENNLVPLERLRRAWIHLVSRLIYRRARDRRREWQKLSLELRKAGIPLSPQEYLAMLLALEITVAVAVYLLTDSLVKCIWVVLFLALGSRVQLKSKQIKRVRAFDAQLFDALTMMSNSLRAGYSFFQAMDVAATEMSPPLSDEFRNVIRETSVGMDVEDALNGMLQRVPSEDLDLVVTAVLIQRQVGGNLSEILDKIGTTIRERMRLKGEVKTLTAQGRISGLIISVLPLAVSAFIFVSNPDYIMALFLEPIGRIMVTVAVAGQLIGVLIIRRIVQIDV